MKSRFVVVAYACVFVLVSLLLEPVIAGTATAAESRGPDNLNADVAPDSPPQNVPPPDPPVDGPPMGNGGIDWYLDPPTGSIHNVSALPFAGETDDAYFYDTPLGNYTFPKATPHRLRLLGAQGAVVDAAWFDAAIPLAVEGESSVVSRDQTTFVSVYHLLSGGQKVAKIRTTFEFFADRPPKVSAVLTPLVKLTGSNTAKPLGNHLHSILATPSRSVTQIGEIRKLSKVLGRFPVDGPGGKSGGNQAEFTLRMARL